MGSPANVDMGMGAIAVYIYNLNRRLYTVRIMMNASTVMNRPPSRVTAHRGMLSQKPTLLILSMISCGSRRSAASRQAGLGNDGGNHPLNDFENGQHEVEAYPTAAFASTKRMNILNAASGRFRSARLEQVLTTPTAKNKTSRPYPMAFRAPVDVQHDLPDPAAFEGCGILGKQRPDFSQLVVPCFQRRI